MEHFYNRIGSFKREDLRMGFLVIDILDESIKFLINPNHYAVKQNSHPNDNEMKNSKFVSTGKNRNTLANRRIALKI